MWTAEIGYCALTFDWSHAKPWLNARTTELLGRPFAINGDLSLSWEKPTVVAGPSGQDEDWSSKIPWPYLAAQDIHIGKPSNMKALMSAEMANIKQFTFSLNPLILLEKQIAIPVLHSNRPSSACCAALRVRSTGFDHQPQQQKLARAFAQSAALCARQLHAAERQYRQGGIGNESGWRDCTGDLGAGRGTDPFNQ